jgi:hypothetical protein
MFPPQAIRRGKTDWLQETIAVHSPFGRFCGFTQLIALTAVDLN